MRCDDALKYVSPYLDSELDPKTSFDIARHLEQCEACRQRFNAERALETRISSDVKRSQPEDERVWADAVRRVSRRRKRWWFIPVAAAALAVVAALVLTRARHDLIDELRHDHEKLVSGAAHFDLASSDAKSIEEFFAAQMGLAVRLPPSAEMRPAGARKCSLRGVPTAFVAFRYGSEWVSVAIFDGTHLDRFPRDAAALADGPLEHSGSPSMIVRRSGWKVVCVTSGLPLETLRRVASAIPE